MAAIIDAIRPSIQAITYKFPAPVDNLGRDLIGPFCYKTLVKDIELLAHPECLKLAVSKGLGIGIIGASSIVKVPQLLKLLNTQNATGISFTSYLLESSAYLISLAYNVRNGFPFSTYGETALILVQNIVIAALVLRFSGQTAGVGAWIAGLTAAGYALFQENSGLVGAERLKLLQAGAGVLGVAAKVPQILTIWREGTTGQLSAFAVFNYLAGSLARVFTTIQEVPDPLILYGFIAGFVLNLVLAGQMVYYWNSKPATTKSKGKGKAVAQRRTNPEVQIPATSSATGSAQKPKTPSTRRRG